MTISVIEEHLALRKDGAVEEDIQRNYDPDVVLLTGSGIFRGPDGVRECAAALSDYLGQNAAVQIESIQVSGCYAFIEWSGWDGDREVSDGADSFHVEDNKIVMQTIHYTSARNPK